MSEPVSNGLASGGLAGGGLATSGLAARGLVRIVRAYQHHLSPRKPAPTCRFTPTCSEYAVQAIERFGAVRGGWLATWRIMRCNPLVEGGLDPVPTHFPAKHPPVTKDLLSDLPSKQDPQVKSEKKRIHE